MLNFSLPKNKEQTERDFETKFDVKVWALQLLLCVLL